MAEPYQRRAEWFQRELRSTKAVNRELWEKLFRSERSANEYRGRLILTERFLMSQGYRRLDLQGNWTKEPLGETT